MQIKYATRFTQDSIQDFKITTIQDHHRKILISHCLLQK